MHMRTKKWARPELAACPYFTDEPEALRGHWRERFEADQPLWLELGCGKGVSTAKMAAATRGVNFIAMDISPDVLGWARRNIERNFQGDPVKNMMLAKGDIEYIGKFFAPEDRISRIYISFCNPWRRPRHLKRRLTHPRQLMQYRGFLEPDAEIWFKTDDDGLFEDSLVYFAACGFEQVYLTRDLHASGFEPNFVSEHERMYAAQGVPIKFGIFRMGPPPEKELPLRWRIGDDEIGRESTNATVSDQLALHGDGGQAEPGERL